MSSRWLLVFIAGCSSEAPDVGSICRQAVECAGQQQVAGVEDACSEVFEAARTQSADAGCGDEHDAWLVCVEGALVCLDDGTIDAPDCVDAQGCLDDCLSG